MQQRIYQTKVHDVYELRQRLIDVLHELWQSVINDVIDEWYKPLRVYVRAKRGHILSI